MDRVTNCPGAQVKQMMILLPWMKLWRHLVDLDGSLSAGQEESVKAEKAAVQAQLCQTGGEHEQKSSQPLPIFLRHSELNMHMFASMLGATRRMLEDLSLCNKGRRDAISHELLVGWKSHAVWDLTEAASILQLLLDHNAVAK